MWQFRRYLGRIRESRHQLLIPERILKIFFPLALWNLYPITCPLFLEFMRKILITGASGFLGWHLCQNLLHQNSQNQNSQNPSWDVYGTYFSQSLEIPGVKLEKTNLADSNELKTFFTTIKPDAVIHTAALSQPNYCQNHPDQSHAINVTASWEIAQLCADAGIPLAFTSTDLVFDGLNAPYNETAAVNPVNLYGEQKVLAEQGILKIYPQAAICRMPLMFGNATPTASSFMQGFIQKLQQGEDLSLFTDEYRTPVSGAIAAQGLLLAVTQQQTNKNWQGITHLGGKERLSRYDFGKLMVAAFGLPEKHLLACRQADVKMSAPRPKDVSLDSSKAFSLGYSPLSIQEQLANLNL